MHLLLSQLDRAAPNAVPSTLPHHLEADQPLGQEAKEAPCALAFSEREKRHVYKPNGSAWKSEKSEERLALHAGSRASRPKSKWRALKDARSRWPLGGIAIFLLWALVLGKSYVGKSYVGRESNNVIPTSSLGEKSWKTLQHHASLLDVPGISREGFLNRQAILADVLVEAGVDAFIAEPSASSSYYANVSTSFELSERPFLIIIDKHGKFSYLAPKFELGRIGGLEMVFEEKTIIEWHEEESPYKALKRATGYEKIMLDEHVRYFIATGLESADIEVTAITNAVQSIRTVKSDGELAILRGINEFTVELVRSLQQNTKVGMTQGAIFTAATALFAKVGLEEDSWALVLLGPQASNPHGGSFGKVLERNEYVLIDIGSNLHGYGSDVTRTFLPAGSTPTKEQLDTWYTVYNAQSAAIKLTKVNETCSAVDAGTRKIITAAGFGEFFTHRLGHGLGLEMHEHPFLNGANAEKLKAGQVVTNEPGIYVTPEQAHKLHLATGFGTRLEDAVLVTAEGGVVLTGGRAKSPYEP